MGILKTKWYIVPIGTKPFSIRNKNAHTHHSVFQNWGWKETKNKTTVVVGTKNLIKHSYGQTDGRINEVRALPLEVGENKTQQSIPMFFWDGTTKKMQNVAETLLFWVAPN